MDENCKADSDCDIIELLIEILLFQGYLSADDISLLDIAIRKADLRKQFLESLKYLKIQDDTEREGRGRGDNLVTWVIKRQVKLSNFKGHCTVQLSLQYLLIR
jgi:hypothetical protein